MVAEAKAYIVVLKVNNTLITEITLYDPASRNN